MKDFYEFVFLVHKRVPKLQSIIILTLMTEIFFPFDKTGSISFSKRRIFSEKVGHKRDKKVKEVSNKFEAAVLIPTQSKPLCEWSNLIGQSEQTLKQNVCIFCEWSSKNVILMFNKAINKRIWFRSFSYALVIVRTPLC